MYWLRVPKILSYSCNSFNILTRGESSLAVLRKKTGYALNLCKKALNESNNDVSAAENWLKEEAIKNGWKKASALGNKSVAEGLVGVFVNKHSDSAVLLEVNCESDFVARNDDFRSLVSQMTKAIASAAVDRISIGTQSTNEISKHVLAEEQIDVPQETIALMITKLGEKIKMRRAILFVNPTINTPNPVKFVGYAHAVGGQPNQLDGVHIGKYGTIVAYKESFDPSDDIDDVIEVGQHTTETKSEVKPSDEEEPLESSSTELDNVSRGHIAHFIAQHIIGLKPTKIRKTQEDIEREQRLSKEGYKISDEDTDSLLDQKFLLNDFFTIRQVLKVKDMKVVDFVRLECGSQEL